MWSALCSDGDGCAFLIWLAPPHSDLAGGRSDLYTIAFVAFQSTRRGIGARAQKYDDIDSLRLLFCFRIGIACCRFNS